MKLLQHQWNVKIVKVFREANSMADLLANEAVLKLHGIYRLERSRSQARFLLDANAVGLSGLV
ncbi:hypothetical protein JCGZ_18471 [Jatropha curcas]|uniref:Uncharacterized protein n=1 Tax=Jatropha curcas TaxID=180498 RepID=A0A067K195_JATCU|nr:hypothetical protein JCGZ_18471 [Jatropha curcas]